MTLRDLAYHSTFSASTHEDQRLLRQLDAFAGELSSNLIGLRADQVDAAAQQAVHQIGEALGIDRSGLVVYAEHGLSIEHEWTWDAEETSTAPAEEQALLPWYRDRALRGETVVLNRLPYDLPEDAVSERAFLQRAPMKSHLAVPVSVAGWKVCVLSATSVQQFHTWNPAVVSKLRLVAELLGSALHRRHQQHLLKVASAESPIAKIASENQYSA